MSAACALVALIVGAAAAAAAGSAQPPAGNVTSPELAAAAPPSSSTETVEQEPPTQRPNDDAPPTTIREDAAIQGAESDEQTAQIARVASSITGEVGSALASAAASANNASNSTDLAAFMPRVQSLFRADAVDSNEIAQMDCHLRNVDLCVAGLIGSAQRVLPETESQFEARCDEMKATSACLAAYNKRCQSFKAFSLFAPALGAGGGGGLQAVAGQQQVPDAAQRLLLGDTLHAKVGAQSGPIRVADLASLCEPQAKGEPANKVLRARLFELAKCVNKRLPGLRPCIEDLKTALQVFYEQDRVLPLEPSCCALGRFRSCAATALDNICGLASFDQLLEALTSESKQMGPFSAMRTIGRACRRGNDYKSAYCVDVLPASGSRAPQPRRSSRASKLARALDLIQFAPATQE